MLNFTIQQEVCVRDCDANLTQLEKKRCQHPTEYRIGGIPTLSSFLSLPRVLPPPPQNPKNLANQTTFFPKFISKLTQNTPPPPRKFELFRDFVSWTCVCVETTTVTPEDTVLFKCHGDIFVLSPQR